MTKKENNYRYFALTGFMLLSLFFAQDLMGQRVRLSYDASGNRTKFEHTDRPEIEALPDSLKLPAGDTAVYVVVKNVGTAPLKWRASSKEDWIIVETATGVESDTLFFSTTQNPLRALRTGELLIIDEDSTLIPYRVFVSQEPGPNTAPALTNPVSDQLLVTGFETYELRLDTVFTDINEDDITLTSTLDNESVVGISLANKTATISYLGEGTTEWVLKADDGFGGEASDTISIEVTSDPILAVSRDSVITSAAASTHSFNIANEGLGTLNWSLSKDADWLDITTPVSGSDQASVAFDLEANPGLTSRIAVITITATDAKGSPQKVIVLQEGIVNTAPQITQEIEDQEYEENFTPVSFDLTEYFSEVDEGDSLKFLASVKEQDDFVPVTLAVEENLLTLSPKDAPGEAIVLIEAYDRQDTTRMDFKVTVKEVDQAILVVDKDSVTVDANATTVRINLTNQGNQPLVWSLDADSEWISFATDESGTGGTEVSVLVAFNNSFESRTGIVEIKADDARQSPAKVVITQEALVNTAPQQTKAFEDRELQVGFSPFSFDLNDYFEEKDEGDSLNFSVEVTNTSILTVSYDEPTMTISSGSGPGTATITVKAFDRRDTVSQSFDVTVKEINEPVLSIDKDTLFVGHEPSVATFNITNPGIQDLVWTIGEFPEWLSLTPLNDTNDSEITVQVSENLTLDQRIGIIEITAENAQNSPGKVVIVQEGQPNTPPIQTQPLPNLELDEGFEAFEIDLFDYFREDDEGDKLGFIAELDKPAVLKVNQVESKLLVAHGTEPGIATFSLKVFDRKDTIFRSFTVTVSEVEEPILDVDKDTIFVSADAAERSFRIINLGNKDLEWSIAPTVDWIIISPGLSGRNNEEIFLQISENEEFEKRMHTLEITGTDAVNSPAKVVVVQEARVNTAPEKADEGIPDVKLIEEGAPVEVDFSNYFSDPDGDELNFIVSIENPNPKVFSFLPDGSKIKFFPGDTQGSIEVNVKAEDPYGAFAEASFNVSLELITAIDDDVLDAEEVLIYPNPASDWINIDLTRGPLLTNPSLAVINADGKVMTEVKELKIRQLRLSLGSLLPGIYTVVINSEQGKIVRKILVRREN